MKTSSRAETVGLWSALAALEALHSLAERLGRRANQRVVVAGHSMGGHGAWRLARSHVMNG